MKKAATKTSGSPILRNNDNVYVDKTRYLYRLVTTDASGAAFLITRPRRCRQVRPCRRSNTRGVFLLKPADCTLAPGAETTLQWRLFAHGGGDDFVRQMLRRGSVSVSCDRYVAEVGRPIRVTLRGVPPKTPVSVSCGGRSVPCGRRADGSAVATVVLRQPGEARVTLRYGVGHTYADVPAVSSFDGLVAKRARFIAEHQQPNLPSDPRDGAFMVYDCEKRCVFMNDTPTVSPLDRNGGVERLGTGIPIAKQVLLTGDEMLKVSLMRCLAFVRTKLQDEHCTTRSNVGHASRHRAYNCPRIAALYLHAYRITGEKRRLTDVYGTMKAMFRRFGHGFCAIDIPVLLSVRLLREAGMAREADDLTADYRRLGDTYVRNGCYYPPHEVNYGQTIVVPAVMPLSQLYIPTRDAHCPDGAKCQLPLPASFCGNRPSVHLDGIAIRHWDGYRFGRYATRGETFPHYRSALTAATYCCFAPASGEPEYFEKAGRIADSNLCQFFEDGTASCACMYPSGINGRKPPAFFDPFANGQDFVLCFWLLVFRNL